MDFLQRLRVIQLAEIQELREIQKRDESYRREMESLEVVFQQRKKSLDEKLQEVIAEIRIARGDPLQSWRDLPTPPVSP